MPPRREARLHAFLPGEPEPPKAPPPARSVSELVSLVQLELGANDALRDVWVKGEISNFFAASSGHWYLDLKDDRALLKAVVWRTAVPRIGFLPLVGMEVLVRASVTVYKDRSLLQLDVMEMHGLSARGDLAFQFEQLKAKLAADGLFDVARKRPVPDHPRCIGIVTSLNAAALHDMLRVATARHPGVRILVSAARVQGEGAAWEVANALRRLDASGRCDVIIVGRGGGSLEDLWAFNDEQLVRAVVAARTPVVSAVGHETDVTLCDLAADLRAATPSNAAELLVPDAAALHEALENSEARMASALARIVPDRRQALDDLLARAEEATKRVVAHERELLARDASRLDALSPLATLARGFAVVQKEGKVLRSARAVKAGDDVTITLKDGALDARVTGGSHVQEE